MIKKLLLIFILPIFCFLFFSFKSLDKPKDKKPKNNSTIGPYKIANRNTNTLSSLQLNANQINTWFRNNGNFNRDPTTGNSGFEWPKGQGTFARYSSGIWIGCVVGSDTLTCVAEYDYDYDPGYVDDSGNPQGESDPSYKIYSITQGDSTSSDYLNWPVSQGAFTDSLGRPLFLGTQTQFYVYTDAYGHSSGQTSLKTLKAQILQTNWEYNVNGPLGNIAFSEFRIINRSNEVWNDTYLSVWTDDDLGDATDDAICCDTTRNLGYTYNIDNADGSYGSAPPAVGFDFFRGPIVQTGNTDDTVRYYSPPGSQNLVTKVGYKELGLTVYNTYNNTSPQPSDPLTNTETYRVITGYWRDGTQWTNPTTGQNTKVVYSGDPVASTGWVMTDGNDRRFIQSSGPFTMNPGDTQSVIVAQVIARGGSNLESITSLRSTSDLAQRIFDNNFQVPESAPEVNVSVYAPDNGKIYLSWDGEAEKVTIPNKLSGGTYKFQGYNVYAVEVGTTGSEAEDRVLIATYDVKDGVTDIKDSVYVDEYGTYVYYTVQKGTDNGISRYIVINKDFINNVPIIKGTEYDLVVTAYYYDELGGPFSAPKVNETPITSDNVLKVIPQNLTAGTQVSYNVGDTIYTDQRDLGVMPLILEPLNLISATYTSTFSSSSTDTTWTLTRNQNGTITVLIQNSSDFTGAQDTTNTVDGFMPVHQVIRDSGVVSDPDDPKFLDPSVVKQTRQYGWSYTPTQNKWLQGPDTTAVKTAKLFTNRQFQTRSMGFSFPTTNTFRGVRSKILANGLSLQPGTGTDASLTGGPLRKIRIVFGQNSMAYRYAAEDGSGNPRNILTGSSADTALTNTPYQDMVSVPFSVYFVDELDSTGGTPQQINVGFVDADADGTWNPDTTELGAYQITYIFASPYSETPSTVYTTKNVGFSGTTGFGGLDIMYAWVPRVMNNNGAPLTYTNGDELIIYPYRPTRGDFVPGFPVRYSWEVQGSVTSDNTLAASEINRIKVFPNPYYGQSTLETDPFDRFIYFSNLPSIATISIYTLDGVLVRRIERNNTDPNNSLEKWDLMNQNGIYVASGMYIAYVDCKQLGAKVLKFAIFTPQERIDTF